MVDAIIVMAAIQPRTTRLELLIGLSPRDRFAAALLFHPVATRRRNPSRRVHQWRSRQNGSHTTMRKLIA
jgi:hypothetical protein